MKRSLLALAAALAVLPAAALAQGLAPVPNAQEYLQFLGGSGVNGTFGVQVGPYSGRFGSDPAAPSFNLYCVDFDHYARSTTVTASKIGGDLGTTRLGSTGGQVAAYTRAAYLASLFESYQGNAAAWSSLHAAIWTTIRGSLDPANPNYGQPVPIGADPARDAFIADAQAAVDGGWSAEGWYVLTPDNGIDVNNPWNGQEFLVRVNVPEPGTLLLMASGLLLLLGFGRSRMEVAREV